MVRDVSSQLRGTEGPRPRAVVVGVHFPGVANDAFESSLRELERLAHTLGIDVVGRVTQRRNGLDTGSVVGAGKLKELAAFTGGKGVVPGYSAPGKKDSDDDGDEDATQPEPAAQDDGAQGDAAEKKEPKARSCSSITTSRPVRCATSSARAARRCSIAQW